MAATTNASDPIVAINVTPFVDVVLVLLIIFMATSSYMSSPAIEVDLPQAASGGEVVESTIALTLDAKGGVHLNGEPATEATIATHCQAASAKNPAIQAMIAADGSAAHKKVVRLIDLVKSNGVNSFALNIDPTQIANN